MNNNVDYKSLWLTIEKQEKKITNNMADLLFANMATEIYNQIATEVIKKEAKNMWWDENEQPVIGDAVTSTINQLYDTKASHFVETEDFRRMLFNRLTNKNILSPDDKEKVKAVFKKHLANAKSSYSKNKNIKNATGKTIAIGQRVSHIMKDDGFKIIFQQTGLPNTEIEEVVRNGVSQYLNSISNKSDEEIVIQQNKTTEGFINELEDRALGVLNRKEFLTELTSFIAGGIREEQTSIYETSSGGNYNYDIKDEVIWSKNNQYYKRDFYFDSKSNLQSIGSKVEPLVITSTDVINSLTDTGRLTRDGLSIWDGLIEYNNSKSSKDNELLLEYLYNQYSNEPYYYFIDKSKEEAYPISYLIDNNLLYMDPKGLDLVTEIIAGNRYHAVYGKAIRK